MFIVDGIVEDFSSDQCSNYNVIIHASILLDENGSPGQSTP